MSASCWELKSCLTVIFGTDISLVMIHRETQLYIENNTVIYYKHIL